MWVSNTWIKGSDLLSEKVVLFLRTVQFSKKCGQTLFVSFCFYTLYFSPVSRPLFFPSLSKHFSFSPFSDTLHFLLFLDPFCFSLILVKFSKKFGPREDCTGHKLFHPEAYRFTHIEVEI